MTAFVPQASRLAGLPLYVCCSRPTTFRGQSGREEEFFSAVSRSLRRLGAHDTTTTSSYRVGRALQDYLVILDVQHAARLLPSVDLTRCLAVVIENLDELCAGSDALPRLGVHGSLAAFASTSDLVGTERCALEWLIVELLSHLYDAD